MNMIKRAINVYFLVVIFVMSVGTERAFPDHSPTINPEIEKNLLTEDWKTVAEKCGQNEKLVVCPVLRAIKGHACLALNRNNESFVLFLSIGNNKDRLAWKAWTDDFVKRHADKPIAHYLKGDALARLGDLELAIQSYNKALKEKSDLVPALIARGVQFVAKRQWNDARNDFERAIDTKPPLAEAYASLGTLLILKKAPEGAYDSYEKALKLSPGYVLALNGLGCAKYGLAEWESANQDFAEAAKNLPLPLFLGNLRALGVAAENLNLPGLENSPLFRFTDFLDWTTLRVETAKEGDLLRTLLGYQLPEQLETNVINKLNKALESPTFYQEVTGKINMKEASKKLLALIEETKSLRTKKAADLTKEGKDRIRLLNRILIECAYPLLIAKHNQRDPGTQLTLTHGLMDQMEYKGSLRPDQIATGQWRIDHLWRPFANALISSGVPVVSFVGRELKQHHEFSTHTNELVCQSKYGISLDTLRPGGVTTEMRRAFVDQGEWPVANWFGLAQSTVYLSRTVDKNKGKSH